jgi:hypothetical protein
MHYLKDGNIFEVWLSFGNGKILTFSEGLTLPLAVSFPMFGRLYSEAEKGGNSLIGF